MIVGLLVLLALTQVHVLASPVRGPARPNYIDCGDSSECGAWECCVLGMGRFSLPRCLPMADMGDPCRPAPRAGQPINTTVTYPDGQLVNLPAVYLQGCPCAAGLQCSADLYVCHDPALHQDLNAL